MLHRTGLLRALVRLTSLGVAVLLVPIVSGQTAIPASDAGQNNSVYSAVRELQDQVRELREAVQEIRSEAARYRAETSELREELRATRLQMAGNGAGSSPNTRTIADSGSSASPRAGDATSQIAPSMEQRVAGLEEQSRLLEGKVDEQYQTKVESASKYRVRLSGIVLMNLFSNRGVVDNQDFPTSVEKPDPILPHGSFGATLRQSELGLEIFGPRVAGATTTGDVQVDFAGGFPNYLNGTTFGIMRLRTATLRMDWKQTSIVGGQDTAFFSPLSPTSFASLAVPAFAYAGNLWAWLPQVRVEHRFDFSNDSNLILQGGVLDNLTGEPPVVTWLNIPQAGERSGQPAYATRIAWTRRAFGNPMTFGAGGFYSRQDWWFGRHVDGWAGTADWDLPLSHGFSLTGEFYRGRGIGGLGGAVGRSAIFSGDLALPTTRVLGLNAAGGWSQLKFKPIEKLEFNGAFGLDHSYAKDLQLFPTNTSYADPNLIQNRSSFVNFIYRPHTNLLFSGEYRHLRTAYIYSPSQTAEQVNLSMGILF